MSVIAFIHGINHVRKGNIIMRNKLSIGALTLTGIGNKPIDYKD